MKKYTEEQMDRYQDEILSTLDNIQKFGIEAKIAKTARNGKEVDDMQKMYKNINNKNKHG